jgi:hypothetical protein
MPLPMVASVTPSWFRAEHDDLARIRYGLLSPSRIFGGICVTVASQEKPMMRAGFDGITGIGGAK